MCRPHGTAFVPPDVCRRKERKEQKKEKKRKEKNSHTQTGYPIPLIIIIESSNPTNLLTILLFWSSFIEKSHDLDAELELGLPKEKKSQQQATSNNQVCLSGEQEELTFHRTTIMSTLQIRADFLLHNRFGSAETTCPTRTRFLHHYPDTNKHISSLIRLINL